MIRKNQNNYLGFFTLSMRRVGQKKDFHETYFLNPRYIHESPADRLGHFAIFSVEMLNNPEQAEEYFLKALKKDPKNAFWLGNYAVFLHFFKHNYEKAAFYYAKSIEQNDDDTFLILNFAYLNVNYFKNFIKADELFAKALEAEPKNPEVNGSYAYFLYKIQKNYEKAFKLIKKAVAYDSQNPLWLTLFAQLLIIKKQKDTAEKIIQKTLRLKINDKSVLLELWFLLFAHFPEYMTEAEINLDFLLQQGAIPGDLDLEYNYLIAVADGHPKPQELKRIIDKINNSIANRHFNKNDKQI